MTIWERIERVLSLLPLTLRKRIRGKIELRKETRAVRGKIVDGSYDHETGQILLWGNLILDDVDLIIVLMHEIGHLLYHQVLSAKETAIWVYKQQKEKLDFNLKGIYPSVQIPEENFCCVCSIVGISVWFEKLDMKDKAEKTKQKLAGMAPKSLRFVERFFQKNKQVPLRGIYHSTVIAIRRWIEEATGPLK